MKKWLLHIMLVGVLGMLAASCSQDEEIANIPSTGTSSEKVTIRFTLDLGEQGGMSSRATWEGYDEDGTSNSNGDENAINNIQVFMFSTDGAYIGGLKDMEYEQQVNSNIYNIKGEVDVVKTAIKNEVLNCKIMVVANANAASVESGKVTDFNNAATFNHNVSYIPMWGIGTYEIDLIQQLIVDLDEPIYMLRSMAKIEVTLNQTVYAEGYRITSATLNKYNTQGYVVPTLPVTTGDNPVVDWSKLTNTTSLSTANVFREYDRLAGTASSPTPKSFAESEAGKSYVIYVPEYDNENELTITLGLTHNSTPIVKEGTTPYTISLNEYKLNDTTGKSEPDTEKPLDLVRNHWYKYTINSISDGMNITLAVAPWEEKNDVLDYTENTVTYNINSTSPWSDLSDYDNTNPQVVLLKTGINVDPAKYMFTLLTPKNAEWRAVLEGEHIEFETGEGYSGELLGGENVSKQIIHGFTSSDNTGTVITLGVKADNSNMDGQFSARLRFYVNLGNKWYEIDLVDGNESTSNGGGLNHWTIKHLKSM